MTDINIAPRSQAVDARARSFARAHHTEASMPSAHQAEDNRVHLAYYDKAHGISFVFNQTKGILVDVCPGGYGEPVTDTFAWNYNLETRVRPELDDFLRAFESACKAHIDRMYGIEAVEEAFRSGLGAGAIAFDDDQDPIKDSEWADGKTFEPYDGRIDSPRSKAYIAGYNIGVSLARQ